MKAEDMRHLASLARIELTDQEVARYSDELGKIVEYVSIVSDLASAADAAAPQVGVRYNVLRDDQVVNKPGQYTDAALREMPQTSGRHMLVKKIMKAK